MDPGTLPPPVDLSDLIDDLGQQEGVISGLIEQYNVDCPRYVENLRQAITAQDGARIEKTAHSLKSLLGIFQALPAYQLAEHLEQKGRDADFTGINALFNQFCTELERVREHLARF
ncbi:Hpt domain-containing protein [Geoalkalibacter halelectricus]|uniref:Hpt domain-containing protein n=1 Tax=Geoalkalibacter halelectricus TaxID=2847045 RepID=A0ABY5ZNQ2_9BACT|nr:Hpt domain-containing protein [Geoalkalibacter halelectricus]MDO3379989.1 Hpt domain-containing protein [Geoalkalibacter halelectricus]UWZ80484.1 Hpt domain-containing protein [Geoalkalibacter halelectricus]